MVIIGLFSFAWFKSDFNCLFLLLADDIVANELWLLIKRRPGVRRYWILFINQNAKLYNCYETIKRGKVLKMHQQYYDRLPHAGITSATQVVVVVAKNDT